MKLKARKLDISAQGHNVCLINSFEAKELHIKNYERVEIKKGAKHIFSLIDITNTHHFLKKGEIGLFSEAYEALSLKNNSFVEINIAEKPSSLEFIKKKMGEHELSDYEIYTLISDIKSSHLSDIEIAHFISACYILGLSEKEMLSLVNAFVNTGNILKFDKYPSVNIKLVGAFSQSIILGTASILTSLGIGIIGISENNYKSSGLSNILDACHVKIPTIKKAEELMKKNHFALISKENNDVIPASSTISSIEHPLSAYPDAITTASILSLGKSVSSSFMYVCLFYGKERKIKNVNHAQSIKKRLERLSKKLKLKLGVIIIDGNTSQERNFGPILECQEIINVLKNEVKQNIFRKNIINISGEIIGVVKKTKNGKKIASEILESGQGFYQFRKILSGYGGVIPDFKNPITRKYELPAKKDGFISSIDNSLALKCARISGSPENIFSGLRINKNNHERVTKGESILTIFSEDEKMFNNSKEFAKKNEIIKIT